MKLLIVLAALAAVKEQNAWKFRHSGNLASLKNTNNKTLIEEQWFEQTLDHFSEGESVTWSQRYFVNEEFYGRDFKGPVFLSISGELGGSGKWMTQGSWIDYAKRFNALCFLLEHRYYGKSHPTKNISTKNLRYLTSQQALADLANFISSMNSRYNMSRNVKWIAFGCSYSGSLAAWLRMEYPHLVHAAVSSSAPLLALVDFKDYYRVVLEALGTYSDKCIEAVKTGTTQIHARLRHSVGQRNLNERFKLCNPIEKSIENKNDLANLFQHLANYFADVVQYNKDNRFDDPSNITIETLCDIMTNKSIGMEVDRLARINELMLTKNNQTCLAYGYDEMITNYKNIRWDNESVLGRTWLYQTCTEFGYFSSSSYKPQIFGSDFPVEFFIQQCVDIFGSKYNATFLNKAIERTNVRYGGLNINVSNVVFVHGSLDPWHALGITKTTNQEAPAIYIEGTAHCANKYPARDSDLPQLSAARQQVAGYIDSWLKQ